MTIKSSGQVVLVRIQDPKSGTTTLFINGPISAGEFLQEIRNLPPRSTVVWKDELQRHEGRKWFDDSVRVLRSYLETSRYKQHYVTIIADGKTIFQTADLPPKSRLAV